MPLHRRKPDLIKALLKEAVAAGAFGFRTTNILQHIGYQGRPLACRLASESELKAYCNALRELGKGAIEIALTRTPAVMAEVLPEVKSWKTEALHEPVALTMPAHAAA